MHDIDMRDAEINGDARVHYVKIKSIRVKRCACIIPALLLLAVCFAIAGIGFGLFITSSKHSTYQNDHKAFLSELWQSEIGQTLPNNATKSESNTIVRKLDKSETYSYLTMFGAHKVQESLARLPKWLQDYVVWHTEQRKKPSRLCKFLIIPCLQGSRCGGTSDRLRPLPYWLLLAKLTERVLIIKWDKPHDLHEFLVPPPGGLDWRSFPAIESRVINGRHSRRPNRFLTHFWADPRGACGDQYKYSMANCTITQVVPRIREAVDKQFVTVSFTKRHRQIINEGNMLAQQFSYENEMPIISGWESAEMIGDIFRVMFEPVPALAHQINRTMASLGLREGEYVSSHVRVRYSGVAGNAPVDRGIKRKMDKDGGVFRFYGDMKSFSMKMSSNAINCGHFLSPGLPVLLLSDSHHVTNFWNSTGTKSVRENANVTVLAVNRPKEPPHIDRDDGWPGSKPSDFFSVFEDILMMGGSKCVAHGIGSFGSFGSGLIGNRCKTSHRQSNGAVRKCPNDSGERLLIPTDPILVKGLMPE